MIFFIGKGNNFFIEFIYTSDLLIGNMRTIRPYKLDRLRINIL